MYIEFAVDVACMGLDRVQREKEPGCDLSIGQPFGDEFKHFQFAFTQRFDESRRRMDCSESQMVSAYP